MTSVSQALAAAGVALSGLPSPSADARALVSHVLGVAPSRLLAGGPLTAAQDDALAVAIGRRLSGEPVQHITGEAYFRTISVRVGPGVFVPRPETEVLAGWAVDQVRQGRRTVVELCAGSGAISSSIASESPGAAQWAVERDQRAYGYLTANLAGTGVASVHADMAVALRDQDGLVDLVVANPPYLPDGQELPDDVRKDPPEALFSGPLGLDATRTVAAVAWRLLRPGGVVGSEHGDDQGDPVRAIFIDVGFNDVRTNRDLTGRPRFVTARKPANPSQT